MNTKQLVVSQESLNQLKHQNMIFEQSNIKLGAQDKVLFNMIADALRKKDNLRANMFANELSRVRHLKRVFSQSQLIIECLTIRMESLLDLYNAIQMDPISQAIKDVLNDVQGISPEFVSGLEKLTVLASDTLKQTTLGFKQPILDDIFNAKNPESIEILKEVSSAIEGCLVEKFPEPPVREASKILEREVEVIAYDYESRYAPSKAVATNTSIDIKMLSDDVVKILNTLDPKSELKMDDARARSSKSSKIGI